MDPTSATSAPNRHRKRLLLAALGVVLVVGAYAAFELFAPKGTTTVDQPVGGAMMSDGQTALASGTFSGADRAHNVDGTVTLYRADDGAHFLRFEDYDATSGPDVYFYLYQGEGTDAVEQSGLRVPVPGGAEDGQATLRGNFNVPLPAAFEPADWDRVLVWCEDFNVLFGSATLS